MYIRAVQRCETLCCRFSVIHLFHVSIIIGRHCTYIFEVQMREIWYLGTYMFFSQTEIGVSNSQWPKLHLLSVIVRAPTKHPDGALYIVCTVFADGWIGEKWSRTFFLRKPLGRPSWWCQRQGPDKKALQLLQKFSNWERGLEEGEGGRSNLAQSKKSSENARKDDRAISF